MPRNLYYISDEAYDSLWRKAVETKFIHRGANSGKGMSDYIAEASKCKFIDTRPEEFSRLDAARRTLGLTCYWSDGDTRKARMLTFNEETIERLCSIAVDFHIGIGKSHRSKKVILRTTTATISRVLEAMGKNWLVTTGVNIKKSDRELHAD